MLRHLSFAVPYSAVLPLALGLSLSACGDDADPSGPTGPGGGGAGASGGGAGASGGAGGDTGGVGGAGGEGGAAFVPTPESIQFEALAPLPSTEQILINDWNPQPNVVRTMDPTGANVADVFAAYRIWSMGVSGDASAIAFSSGDPLQEQHYGLTLGDAIQHTFLYDAAAQTAQVLAHGNINDECHIFAPGDASLYLCRRYDFTAGGMFSGYQVGRIDLASEAFELLTEAMPTEFTLFPAPTPDGSAFFYLRIEISGGSQNRSIRRRDLRTGADELFLDEASAPVLSPDGTRLLFADTTDMSKLYSVDLTGGDKTLVADRSGTEAAYSPDGLHIAYLLWDDAVTCSHVETVAADGSEASSPTRIRDCGQSGELITELSWIDPPG